MKGNSIDEKRSIALMRDAVDKGINYFDTAYFYNNGRSESMLEKPYREDIDRRLK
jgi:aryl-alcohol dehydrogenase-like predicted oxidoreductase